MKKNLIKTLFASSLLAVGAVSLIGCSTNAKDSLSSVTSFLKIDGIEGESSDKNHKNWIDIENYVVDFSTRGDEVTILPDYLGYSKPIVINKRVDRATPKLFQLGCKSSELRRAELESFNVDSTIITQYQFEGCLIVSDEVANFNEVFKFVAQKITYKVSYTNPDGSTTTDEHFIDYTQFVVA